MFACQLIHNRLDCQFWACTYLHALQGGMGEKALYISHSPKNPTELHLDIQCFKQNQLLFMHVQNHQCGSHWNTVRYNLWRGQSVALINWICTDKISQNATLLFTLSNYMFQPIEGAVPILQVWKTFALLSIYFCIVSDDSPFHGLKHIMSEFCK